MKNVKAILAAAVVAAGLGSTAKAISLGALIGDPSYQGTLVFKYTNYDEGQIYNTPAYNPLGNNSYAANSLTTVGSPNHYFTDINTIDSRFTSSDSWGIFRVSEIYKFGAPTPSWSAAADLTQEITGVFWGIQDQTVVVENNGSTSVYGVGANYALFLDGTPDFNPNSGPTSASLNSAIDGTAVLTGVGSPIGLVADPSADFYSNYKIGGGTILQPLLGIYSSGVSLGVTSTVNIGGAVTGIWNSDIAPEYSVQFTGVPYKNNDTSSWDVLSNDPLMVTVIPTPTAVWGGVIMAGFVGLNVIRRRRAE